MVPTRLKTNLKKAMATRGFELILKRSRIMRNCLNPPKEDEVLQIIRKMSIKRVRIVTTVRSGDTWSRIADTKKEKVAGKDK